MEDIDEQMFSASMTEACTRVEHWAEQLLTRNPILIDKIMAQLKIHNTNEAQQGLSEVLKFLVLCSNSQHTLTPSKQVDLVWHEFILFTRSYGEFCNRYLQKFIHHQPSNIPSVETQQYNTTLDLYQRVFGPPNRLFWSSSNAKVSDCGMCES